MDRVERRHKWNILGRNAVRQQAVDCTKRKNVTGRWRAASNRWRDMVKVTIILPSRREDQVSQNRSDTSARAD